ncbi:MAG: aromatic ring-hydroxylating dioxygenase subunit alpha [Ilumatobacteraceae bacterium]
MADPMWFDNTHPLLRRCWHPVARVEELVDDGPLAVELLGERWCVARLDGRLAALRDECPHRLAPLSAGIVEVDAAGAGLRCAYHGYRFRADGTCIEIPALGPDATIPSRAACETAAGVAEHLGLVWIAPEPPVTDLPRIAEHDDDSFVRCPLPPLTWNASAAQMTDNFLDPGHLGFLHLDTFGAIEDRQVSDYEVVRDGPSFSVRYQHTTKALADSFQAGDEFRTVERESFWVFTPPHHVYLRLSYPDEATVMSITFFHQPVDAEHTRVYCTDYRNDIADDPAQIAGVVAFQEAVAAEDKALLERLRRKAVPLDPTVEFHTKADKITLEMRRVLRDLVEQVGAPT